ncbi:MAG TPA: pirin-like C-terminal cupin domain-containing protein [Acidimicrobiales bacterium]|nr:pirin-like C-terminal cupin domain-containing protein [Acidimicrobiales bacterium]
MRAVTVTPGAELDLAWDPGFNALVYVLAGRGSVGSERRPVATGQLASFGRGRWLRLGADIAPDGPDGRLEVLVLGGRRIGEPVEHYGPFVMNTRAEIVQALEDYQKGRLGVIPPGALMPHVARAARDGDGR